MPRFAPRILIIPLFFILAGTCAGQPTISFDKMKHDYGDIQYGETVKASFEFKNTGDKNLKIKKIMTSCGCTKALRGASLVHPGESSFIDVSFDTAGLKGGRKKKKIIVYSNDPDKSVITLLLYADVIKDVSVAPGSLAKRIDRQTKEVIFELTAKNGSKSPITLKLKPVKGAKVEAKLNPETVKVSPDSKKDFKVILHLNGVGDLRFYMGRIFLACDHPVEREVSIKYLIEME